MSRSLSTSDGGSERQWLDDDATTVEDPPADSAANLVSLGFFTAALRRSKWFWRTTAVVGLLVGSGLYLKAPHTYQASTTLLLTVGAEAQPGTAILEDQALAQSHSHGRARPAQAGAAGKRRQLPRVVHGHAPYRPGTSDNGHRAIEHRSGAPSECAGHRVPHVPRRRSCEQSSNSSSPRSTSRSARASNNSHRSASKSANCPHHLRSGPGSPPCGRRADSDLIAARAAGKRHQGGHRS